MSRWGVELAPESTLRLSLLFLPPGLFPTVLLFSRANPSLPPTRFKRVLNLSFPAHPPGFFFSLVSFPIFIRTGIRTLSHLYGPYVTDTSDIGLLLSLCTRTYGYSVMFFFAM
ncbi:hypothetical protein M378DRAFT_524820 [Amanita muscaria Koide BX008]|uniref:Uncharacterized protein n=1 Tax=Amanita muscaria (strain Koide BX008) TaxID=946122 RepID=A0A0C2WI70_AMAMK|nr:hypothetical protein M378DRAFT_524820 [Amanita muscaria Koide BX008]